MDIASPPVAALGAWVSADHFNAAVLVPALAWGLVLLTETLRGSYSKELCAWWLVASVLTFLSGRWEFSQDEVSLHLVCVFSLICFFLVYVKKAVPPLLAGALVFYSLLLNDVAHACAQVWAGRFDAVTFLAGVGGAGVYDALVVFPLMTAVMLMYANCRMGKAQRLALWY